MSIKLQFVPGAAVTREASLILQEAWEPPSLRYTTDYVAWQLLFPSERSHPCIIVRDNGEPVGFAAVIPRRLRRGVKQWDSGIVSFIAVRPAWRGRRLSLLMYEALCAAIREIGQPVVTFGIEGTSGAKLIERVYGNAGFKVLPLGPYPIYSFIVRKDRTPAGPWEAEVCSCLPLREIISEMGEDTGIVISDPSDAQLRHYLRDPRPRTLMMLRNRATGLLGAAWVIVSEGLTNQGVQQSIVIESVYLASYDAEAIPSLMHAAAAWARAPSSAVVYATNLGGFDPSALRTTAIRITGRGFLGYCCVPPTAGLVEGVRATNMEII